MGEFVPNPDTAHPDIERHADGIRASMYNRGQIKVLRPKRPYFNRENSNQLISQDIRVLTLKTFYAHAPYVGRPFMYFWDGVIEKDEGLWVAGSVRIEYIPDELLVENMRYS